MCQLLVHIVESMHKVCSCYYDQIYSQVLCYHLCWIKVCTYQVYNGTQIIFSLQKKEKKQERPKTTPTTPSTTLHPSPLVYPTTPPSMTLPNFSYIISPTTPTIPPTTPPTSQPHIPLVTMIKIKAVPYSGLGNKILMQHW